MVQRLSLHPQATLGYTIPLWISLSTVIHLLGLRNLPGCIILNKVQNLLGFILSVVYSTRFLDRCKWLTHHCPATQHSFTDWMSFLLHTDLSITYLKFLQLLIFSLFSQFWHSQSCQRFGLREHECFSLSTIHLNFIHVLSNLISHLIVLKNITTKSHNFWLIFPHWRAWQLLLTFMFNNLRPEWI